MNIEQEAVRLHSLGYNCAQCVLKACGEYYPELEGNVLSRVAAGFGGGVNCGNICGALSGAVMALGLAGEFDEGAVLSSKAGANQLTKYCVGEFNKKFNSVLCSELRGGEFSCNELIAFGAELAEKIIKKMR